MDDREILDLLMRRDEQAIQGLQIRFGHRLQRLAQNILSSEADAQECVSDTYLAVWNSIPPRRPLSLSAYVIRVCKNISISRLRANMAQKRSGYEVALDELSEAIGTQTLEETLAARELGQAIDRFLDTLNAESRVIFLRRYWYGDSIADIARLVSLSENTVYVRLSRSRAKLREHLKKEGYYE